MRDSSIVPDARERRYYASLTRNMVLGIMLVALTPLVLIAGVTGYYFETAYRHKVIENLTELVEKHQQHINSFLNERLADIKFIANSYSYDQLSNEKFLQDTLVTLNNSYPDVFVDLGVLKPDGQQIAYAGKFKLLNANYAKADWFREAMKKEFYLSDVFPGIRRKPHFIVCVRKKVGDRQWLLRATVNFASFNSVVEEVHIGKTGSAFIVNRAGELQSGFRTKPVKNIVGLLGFTPRTRPAAWTDSAVTMLPDGKGVKAMARIGKKAFIFILMPLKSGDWTLVYQQDRSDAFSQINRARTIAFSIFFPGCLAIALVTLFISRRMVRKIERADQEKELMNRQVIEAGKLASIGELAAGVAHEINNPVAIMVEEAGWMQDLLEEEEPGKWQNLDEFRHCLRQISVQGERCKEITHKLLSFARKTDPVPRTIQLNDIIAEILTICEKRSQTGNIEIKTDLDRDLPLVFASPSEMQQVFMNLINNAIDAIGEGGTIEIRSRLEGEDAVVDIADTGRGIPTDILERIFDPFFTTKPVGKGTGLGLSICYGILKKLGGNIQVESTVGEGTIFHVHIPAGRSAPLHPESTGRV